MRELKSVEEKILDRALYLFGKNGSTNVPIRAIAKEAGVNVSAINYYFRSKDEMLSNVQAFYIENTIAAYSQLDNEDLSEEDKVILCANEIMEYCLRYPGVLVMQKEACNAEVKDEMSEKIINTTIEMNKKLESVLAKVLKCSDDVFPYKKMMFMSSIIYPISDLNVEALHKDISINIEKRISYIKHIIETLKCNR